MIKHFRDNGCLGGQVTILWTRAFRCMVETCRVEPSRKHVTIIHVITKSGGIGNFNARARLAHVVDANVKTPFWQHQSIAGFLDALGDEEEGMTLEAALRSAMNEFKIYGKWESLDKASAQAGTELEPLVRAEIFCG